MTPGRHRTQRVTVTKLRRALFLAQGYPCPENPLGGAFHRRQLQLVSASGFETTVIVPVPWVPPGLAGRSARWQQYAALPAQQWDGDVCIYRPRYLAFPGENRRGWPDIFQTAAVRLELLRCGYGQPDLVHAFFGLPTAAVARRLARSWGIPYGVSLLGDDVNIYPHHNRRNMRLLCSVLRDAQVRIANGPTLAAAASRLAGITVDSLSIGVDPDLFFQLPDRATARRTLGLPDNHFLALYVGALSTNKGMGELSEAMNMLAEDEISVAIVGDGPWRHELERRPGIRCLGLRSSPEVAMAMAAADLLVHPSHYEGLPTVLLEAGLAGLPVLTTDAPGCVDVAADGRGWIIPAKDSAALAQGLRHAANDPHGRNIRAVALTAYVRKQHLVAENTADLMGRYAVALAGRPR